MTFHFGSPEDQANMYWDGALTVGGPLLPSAPLDELSLQDVRNALAYARIACKVAEESGATADTYAELVARHDAVFAYLCSIDEHFRQRVTGERPGMKPFWLGGYDPENIQKYIDLASAN